MRQALPQGTAIAEAVQRPTMNFVAIKTPEQSDLLSLHHVRSRLVRQRTAIINQIRGLRMQRGITVRQGPGPLAQRTAPSLELTSRDPLVAHPAPHRRTREGLASPRRASRSP